MNKKETKGERCSNCYYNKYDSDLKRYYCTNEDSDFYDSTTEYEDSCEMWLEKRRTEK